MSDGKVIVDSEFKGDSAEKGFNTFQGKMDNLAKKAASVGKGMSTYLTAPITAVGAAFLATAVKTGDYADRILDLNAITGMSTDSIQEWQHVAKVAGVSTEAVTHAVEGLTKKIPAIEKGIQKTSLSLELLGVSADEFYSLPHDKQLKVLSNSFETVDMNSISARDSFDQLGLSIEDFKGMKPEDIANEFSASLLAITNEGSGAVEALRRLGISTTGFMEMSADERMDKLITNLSEMEDVTERNSLGAQLFGGAWKDIAPILAMGADGIEEAKERARELGVVMSEDALEDANDFRIAMAELTAQFGGFFRMIGAKIAPLLTETLIPLIQDKVMPAILNLVDNVMVLIDWFMDLSPATQTVILSIIGVVAAIGPLLVMLPLITGFIGALSGAFAFIVSPIGLVIVAIAALVAGFIYMWNTSETFRDVITSVFNAVKEIITSVLNFVKDLITKTLEFVFAFWEKHGELIKKITKAAFDFIFETIKVVMTLISKFIGTTFTAIKGIIKSALDIIMGVVKAFSSLLTGDWKGLWEGIKQFLSGILGVIKNTISLALSGFTSLFSTFGTKISEIVSKAFNGVLDFIKGIGRNFYNAGANIISSVADGIRSAVGQVTGAMSDVMSRVRDFLPFSPAKVGPLKTLDNLDFAGPIEDSIFKGMPKVELAIAKMLNIPDLSIAGGRNDDVNNSKSMNVNITNNITSENLTPSQIARKQQLMIRQLASEMGVL